MKAVVPATSADTTTVVRPKVRANDLLISEMCKHLQRNHPYIEPLPVNSLPLLPTTPPLPSPMVSLTPFNPFQGALPQTSEVP